MLWFLCMCGLHGRKFHKNTTLETCSVLVLPTVLSHVYIAFLPFWKMCRTLSLHIWTKAKVNSRYTQHSLVIFFFFYYCMRFLIALLSDALFPQIFRSVTTAEITRGLGLRLSFSLPVTIGNKLNDLTDASSKKIFLKAFTNWVSKEKYVYNVVWP